MFAKLRPSHFFNKNVEETTPKQQKPIEIKLKSKLQSSQLIKHEKQTGNTKLIKSQPQLQKIHEQANEVNEMNTGTYGILPRFLRTYPGESPKKKQIVNFRYLSPAARNPVLIHQPTETQQPKQQTPAFKRQIIPPSNLSHDRMKNFQQNPQKFLLNLDEGLDKVFKKSTQSIIRNAKVVPVKDSEIRDSTDLLAGFTGTN